MATGINHDENLGFGPRSLGPKALRVSHGHRNQPLDAPGPESTVNWWGGGQHTKARGGVGRGSGKGSQPQPKRGGGSVMGFYAETKRGGGLVMGFSTQTKRYPPHLPLPPPYRTQPERGGGFGYGPLRAVTEEGGGFG